MRLRRDDVPGVASPARWVVVGVAGAAWGLGLGRLLAEAGLQSSLYASRLVVALVALCCGLLLVVLWRLFSPPLRASLTIPLALPSLYIAGVVGGPLAGGALVVGGAGLTVLGAMLALWQDGRRWVLPLVVGLMTLALDVRTLLPSIGEADTLEFQVVAAKLGVAHPTGYPLYVLLGKLFTLLPVKNVAWRVNLSSAVFAAAAVVVLYGIICRLTDRPLLSFLSALAFAFSRTFWSQAVIAEVYTLHNLLVALILWLLLSGEGVGEDRKTEGAQRWQAVLFLMGMSMTNHLTTALLIPATGLALLWDRPRLRIRDWMVAGGLLLLGLAVYLFIPLRWPAINDGELMTLRDFVIYVTGGQFHGALRLAGWRDPIRWRIVGRLLHQPFGWIGLSLAGLGVMDLSVRDRRALALTGVTFLAFLVYGLVYTVPDIAVFLLPAHLVLAIWMGCGVALLARLLASISLSAPAGTARAAWRSALVTVFALVPLSLIWSNMPAVDKSRDRGSHAWGQYVLSQPLARESAVLADTKKFAPLYYLQQVEGVRPDLDIVLLGSENLYQADLRRRLAAGQIVYLARYLPHLEGLYLRSVGPLVEVGGDPLSRAHGAVSGGSAASGEVIGRFGAGIRLVGADVDEDPAERALYHVTLHWQAQTVVREDLVVRIRLVDASGQVRWTGGGQRPVNGLYPTNAWAVKVPISDYHELPIPPWLSPGAYSLQVGLFSPFHEEGLESDADATSWLPLCAVNIELPPESKALRRGPLVALAGGIWLTGADVAKEIAADTPLTVDLSWHNVEQDEGVQLSWVDGEGSEIRSADSAEAPEIAVFSFPLPAGMVRSRHTIAVPSEAGLYSLRVGLVGKPARCGWLARPEGSCAVEGVHVLAAEEGLATFGDRVLLVEAELGRREATPGDLIPVILRWRGLRAMEEDYTVFIHLVGPDGRLHGQVDSWPVQGTHPTSQWRPAQEVSDPYEVRLAPDAPPGRYRVEVGLYELETMERLRILDKAGKAVADSFVVGTFDAAE